MKAVLSVIIPVYNVENYLQKCLESICNQRYQKIEIILVNDGSTDKSGEICDYYREHDSRIKVIHKENEGLIKARLTGIQNAIADYITFIDSDDWIDHDAYERIVSLLNGADMVISGIKRYINSDTIAREEPLLEKGVYIRRDIECKIIPTMLWESTKNGWEVDPSLCTKIFKKKKILPIMERACSLPIYYGEDTAVIYPLILECEKIVVVKECYYYHRIRRRETIAPYLEDEQFYDKLFLLYQYLKDIFVCTKYKVILMKQLEGFYLKSTELRKNFLYERKEDVVPVFPFWKVEKSSNIILYGAGKRGQEYYRQNEMYSFCNIVAWVDKNYVNCRHMNIVSPDKISDYQFDYIVIAIMNYTIAKGVRDGLISKGVVAEKVLWSESSVKSFDTDN